MIDGGAPVTLPRGACVVSIDTELAWGTAHYRDGAGPGHRFEREREVVDRALGIFARHGVAATWAIVGHLFLDRCERGADGRPHSDLARPDYPWLAGDWFDVDPCSTLAEAPYWYGRDMVDQIRTCPVPQEIACHGFSHMMIGDAGSSAEVFNSELAASAAAAGEVALTMRSFVFPRTSVGFVDCLPDHGYVAYRDRRLGQAFGSRPHWQRKLLRLADMVRPLAGSAVTPARHPSGVWNIPQTYLYAPATQRPRVPIALWVRRPIARLRAAARHRALFHLYFHPYNLTAAPDRTLEGLDRICAAAARLRDAGRLDMMTMGQLADRLSQDNTHRRARG